MKQAGVLLHISSLPGAYGCGTLGRAAYEFADFLGESGFSLWQVLPLNWPHAAGSPYSSRCTYLQNPLFIDPDTLFEKELLTADEIAQLKADTTQNGASFDLLYSIREPFLRRAAKRARCVPYASALSRFLQERARVLEGCQFLSQAGSDDELFYLAFLQYEFHFQWQALREHCHARGVRLVGDLPFYPDLHSSEVLYHRECFLLDGEGAPLFESGVAGDSFADGGQHWGHPLYRNDVLRAQDYAPLLERFLHAATLYDLIRIDHFQALYRYYAIPTGEPVHKGHWEPGLGEDFLHALTQKLPPERLIAEDLGRFQAQSRALAGRFDIPPMNVLQFALLGGSSAADFAPHSVAYTGTHDCDTLVGFFASLPAAGRADIAARLGESPGQSDRLLALAAMRQLAACPAERVIFQAQDLLLLDSRARMNVPGTTKGNWLWRLSDMQADSLRNLPPLWD